MRVLTLLFDLVSVLDFCVKRSISAVLQTLTYFLSVCLLLLDARLCLVSQLLSLLEDPAPTNLTEGVGSEILAVARHSSMSTEYMRDDSPPYLSTQMPPSSILVAAMTLKPDVFNTLSLGPATPGDCAAGLSHVVKGEGCGQTQKLIS